MLRENIKQTVYIYPLGRVDLEAEFLKGAESRVLACLRLQWGDMAIIVHVDAEAIKSGETAIVQKLAAYNAVLRYCHQQHTPSAFAVQRMADMLANHQATIAAAYRPVDELRRKYAEAKRDGKDNKALKTLETRGANARAKADNDTRRIRFEAAVIERWLESVSSERMAA